MVVRSDDLFLFTPKPLRRPKASIASVAFPMEVSVVWPTTVSSANAQILAPGMDASVCSRGSYASTNRRGERGQPCLTPRLIVMVYFALGAMVGVTVTSFIRPRTMFMTHGGKPSFSSTANRYGWSRLSKALAVSMKRR